MLNEYLNSLNEQEKEKTAAQERFGAASVEELAKLAGVSLGEHVCTNCGNTMEKLASTWRCTCGMQKKASLKGFDKLLKGKSLEELGKMYNKVVSSPSAHRGFGGAPAVGKINKELVNRGLSPSQAGKLFKKTAVIGPLVDIGHLGIPSGLGYLMGKHEGRELARSGEDYDEPSLALGALIPGYIGYRFGKGSGYKEALKKRVKDPEATKEASVKLAELVDLCDGDLEKVASALEAQGMDKEAIMPILKAIGGAAKGLFRAAKGAPKGMIGPQMGVGQAARVGASNVGKAAKSYGKGLKETAQKAYQAGGWGPATGRSGAQQFSKLRGTMAAGKELVKQNPGTAAGIGMAGAYGMGKASSDNRLMKVADAAGRLMAKMANVPGMEAPIPIDELRESIEEAQAREDIPGRAKRWQISGGLGGGLLGGGAGYGAGRFVGPKAGLVGAGLGAAGGAFGGQALGKAHGAEEARADKAIAMLRALRAHQQGAMSGYGAGMQRGYSMGQGGRGGQEDR